MDLVVKLGKGLGNIPVLWCFSDNFFLLSMCDAWVWLQLRAQK